MTFHLRLLVGRAVCQLNNLRVSPKGISGSISLNRTKGENRIREKNGRTGEFWKPDAKEKRKGGRTEDGEMEEFLGCPYLYIILFYPNIFFNSQQNKKSIEYVKYTACS